MKKTVKKIICAIMCAAIFSSTALCNGALVSTAAEVAPVSAQIQLYGGRCVYDKIYFTTDIKTNYKINWQIKRQNDAVYSDIPGAADESYTVKAEDVGASVRVKLTPDGADGYVCSSFINIVKKYNYSAPSQPSLTFSDGKLYLIRCSKAQEYVTLKNYKPVSELSDEDWANAVTPNSTVSHQLDCKEGETVYVYTRFKENDIYFHGDVVSYTKFYCGDADGLCGILLSPAGDASTDGATRVKIQPLPYGAKGFEGVYGADIVTDKKYAELYADKKCTVPLDENGLYTEFYIKAKTAGNDIRLSASCGELYDETSYNAYDNGEVPVKVVSVADITSGRGARLYDAELTVYPYDANTEALMFVSDQPSAPVISVGEHPGYVDINAKNADAGVYTFKIISNETRVGEVKVTVTPSAVEADSIKITPSMIYAEPSSSFVLSVRTEPENADMPVLWETDGDAVITGENGRITVAANAEPGLSAVVTVSCGGASDKCTVTVMEKSVKTGDVNGDGSINNKDVVTLFRHVSGIKTANFRPEAADVNGDGSVNNKDVIFLFKQVSKKVK